MAENRCVCCGEIIPEGMIACPNCLVVSKRQATETSDKSQDAVETIISSIDNTFIRPGVFVATTMHIPCLICDESVTVPFGQYSVRICERCKAAVMKVREQDGNS